MKKVLLISPHFDDAVLSAGQFMAGRPDTDVLTVFGGYPKDLDASTPYDVKCGFEKARDAVTVRRQEDDEALSNLQANSFYLEFSDSQYGETHDRNEILKAIKNFILENDYEFVLCPIGISHPDHILVAKIVKSLEPYIDKNIYYWEDLPIRVVEPMEAFKRLNELGVKELVFPGTGPVVKKIRALSCYKSQIGTGILDPYLMYVPERFWK